MSLKHVAIVIVNHNTRDDAVACLETAKQTGAGTVVLVDAGSKDGSADAVRSAHPDVTVIAAKNDGFGASANRGVGTLDQDVQTIIVANADTRFSSDAAEQLDQYLVANDTVGAVGPRVVYPDGSLQLSARSFPDVSTAIGHAVFGLIKPDNRWTRRYRLTDWDHESERDVDWLSGCCLALRSEAFHDVGGFDPEYFMFVEDVDLCWRLSEAGWRVVYAPVTEVEHAVGASVEERPLAMVAEHAKSLDRFFGRRYAPAFPLRWTIRAGLIGWTGTVVAWSAIRGRTHAQAAAPTSEP